MEVNFGFEVCSIAGMAVEKTNQQETDNKESKKDEESKSEDEINSTNDKKDESEAQSQGGESSALLQA
jgi:hypothetical protein